MPVVRLDYAKWHAGCLHVFSPDSRDESRDSTPRLEAEGPFDVRFSASTYNESPLARGSKLLLGLKKWKINSRFHFLLLIATRVHSLARAVISSCSPCLPLRVVTYIQAQLKSIPNKPRVKSKDIKRLNDGPWAQGVDIINMSPVHLSKRYDILENPNEPVLVGPFVAAANPCRGVVLCLRGTLSGT